MKAIGTESFWTSIAEFELKVGFFRRSRTIKGKHAPPSCKESDVSRRVVKSLREDGDPVGHGDALVALLPSFPGIKKLW